MNEERNTGALPSDLKIRNRMIILGAMRDGEEYTAADIAMATGISRPTVMKSIQYFINRGMILECGKGESTLSGGKKPDLFKFVCNKLLLTVTLWPDLLNIHLCTMDLRKIASLKIEAPIKSTPKESFELIKEKALGILKEQGYGIDDLYGVSLSTAGIIDYTSGILKFSSRSPGWGSNIPIRDYMKDIFGKNVEVLIENAGKMTGRSELVRSEEENSRVLVIFSTWGLSACMIEKGHVLSGDHSLIGEVGHMVIDPNDDELCGCGSYGCSERMLSIEKIRKKIISDKGKYKKSNLSSINIEELRIPNVFEFSDKGDKYAREIVLYLADTFAYLIRNISLVFDPNVIVFQGNYAHSDKYFKELLINRLSSFKYFPVLDAPKIEYNARPLEELDLLGAQNFLQRKFFQNEELYN
ncbi:MAG: ROK family transcriptional regulator [Suipraeoptans sp.]